MTMLLAERRGQAGFAPPGVGIERLPWGRLHDSRSRLVLVLPWLFFSLLLAWTMRTQIATLGFEDPDDAMRLLEVRAWLAGQSWWDVTNYRAGGAGGFSMHWSRLVDVPLALLVRGFDLFASRAQAEILAAAILPPLQFLGLLFLLRSTLRCLEFKGGAANIVLLVAPLLTLVTGVTAPLKIDHHAWQALCALVMLRLMVDRRRTDACALRAGAVAGLLVTISVEGLPLVAAACALYAWFHLRGGHDRGLTHFLAGLALTAALLFFATQPVANWSRPWPDAIGWPHLAGFALAAAVACAVQRVRRVPPPPVRAALLGLVAAVGAVPVLWAFGRAGVDPFGALDPLVRHYWLSRIQEVRPIDGLLSANAGVLGWMVVLYVLAFATRWRKAAASANARGWLVVFVLSGAMLALALTMYRVALTAQVLMAPLLAAMLYDTLRVAARLDNPLLRIGLTVAAMLMLSPAGGAFAGKVLAQGSGGTATGSSQVMARECDLTRLAALPEGHVLAPLDLGPAMLLRTRHTIVATGYHRNQQPILRVLRAFTSPAAAARGEIAASGADYLVVCRNTPDVQLYARARADSLAARLLSGRPPEWLTPVPGFADGGLLAWKVR